ncbi:MAG: hypothetical protein E7509_05915 [Ruminococcus sp.]|nr:hypothetical protein [Ruminococcus sp.]
MVTLSEEDEATVLEAAFIKAKCVEVTSATFSIDSVPFNKGFFTVDITYTFNIEIDAYENAQTPPTTVIGTATFNKKVILFGGEGSTKSFSSDDTTTPPALGCGTTTLPRATVTVVEPIVLDAQVRCDNPDADPATCTRSVYVTIGMFSIVQLSRPVPLLVPAYDYCLPEKECCANTESPCELFERIDFPRNEFFPRGLGETDCGCGSDNGICDN